MTGASLGVQDFEDGVQRTVYRIQPFEMTARLVERLGTRGIDAISFDLMYGLPRQTVGSVAETAARSAAPRPGRIALFGFAHVPWIKRHQRMIDESALPDCIERLAQFAAATERLTAAGYRPIGLDHFAFPDDPPARAAAEGSLHRIF